MPFSVPAGPTLHTKVIDAFYGIDYSNDPGNVNEHQSPYAPNMIRDVPGKVRKCMGYQRMAEYGGRINGAHTLRTVDSTGALVYTTLIHAGTALYDKATGAEVCAGLADERSTSVQLGEAMWLLDGNRLLRVMRTADGIAVTPAGEVAYVPTVTISKEPGGGGTAYEPLNMLQPKFTETFFGDGTSTEYHLSYADLDSADVTVQVMDTETGEWVTKPPTLHYTVDAANGVVTFLAAPAEGVGGEDNVSITASKTHAGYADTINKCSICVLYGVNGMPDRMFVSGHPTMINRDWYSAQNDPTYWPDTGYSILGSGRSAVMGYAILNNYLAAYKDVAEPERAVILRNGALSDEGEPLFVLAGTMAGPGVLSKYSCDYLENEPLALTGQGVYALSPSDISGERQSQNRSYYADGGLLKLLNLKEAVACVHNSMYWICTGGEAYILDGLQPMTHSGRPYSTRLYAAFHRTNLPARCIWTEQDGKELWFGSAAGVVYRFYTDPETPTSYNDDGAPVGGAIGACWETPEFGGNVFYRTKNFRWLAVQLRAGLAATASLYGMRDGLWELLREIGAELKYWSWETFDWSSFSWSSNLENQTLSSKTRLKKLARTRYRIENNKIDEPLGLMAIGFDFTEPGGRYKR